MNDRPQRMSKLWIILIILALLALIAGVYFIYNKYYLMGNQEANNQSVEVTNLPTPTSTPAPTITPTPTISPTPTPNKASNTYLNKAKNVAGKFLDARQDRSLSEAKPYMTTSLYNSTSQDGFAGTSSPSMGNYEIISAKYLSSADLYKVKARVHWFLQGEESGTSIWSVYLVYRKGTMLVNEYKETES